MQIYKTLALLLLATTIAAADSRTDQADQLFRQGRAHAAAGRLAEACAEFDESQQLAPATTTLFNQADCREKNRQLATASRLFAQAERETRGATDEVGSRLHEVALARIATLAPRLSTIMIATGNLGVVVLRGSEVLAAADLNRALPIDGGTYTFSARIGDREVWSQTVTIAPEAARETVRIRIAPVVTAPIVSAPVVVTPTRSRRRELLTTAGAAVLLVGALGFERSATATFARAQASHDEALRDRANTRRYLAEGLLVAGVATAGVAAWSWVRRRETPTQRTTQIAPAVGSTMVGLQLDGRW